MCTYANYFRNWLNRKNHAFLTVKKLLLYLLYFCSETLIIVFWNFHINLIIYFKYHGHQSVEMCKHDPMQYLNLQKIALWRLSGIYMIFLTDAALGRNWSFLGFWQYKVSFFCIRSLIPLICVWFSLCVSPYLLYLAPQLARFFGGKGLHFSACHKWHAFFFRILARLRWLGQNRIQHIYRQLLTTQLFDFLSPFSCCDSNFCTRKPREVRLRVWDGNVWLKVNEFYESSFYEFNIAEALPNTLKEQMRVRLNIYVKQHYFCLLFERQEFKKNMRRILIDTKGKKYKGRRTKQGQCEKSKRMKRAKIENEGKK